MVASNFGARIQSAKTRHGVANGATEVGLESEKDRGTRAKRTGFIRELCGVNENPQGELRSKLAATQSDKCFRLGECRDNCLDLVRRRRYQAIVICQALRSSMQNEFGQVRF
jgi:hypothetical protein